MSHENLVVTQHQVRLEPAMACLQAGLARAAELGISVSIAIVDTQGHTVVVVRMDGSGSRTDEGARESVHRRQSRRVHRRVHRDAP